MTATTATNGYRQRPATAHNARTIRANFGYVQPEKRKVGSSTLPLTTASDQLKRPDRDHGPGVFDKAGSQFGSHLPSQRQLSDGHG